MHTVSHDIYLFQIKVQFPAGMDITNYNIISNALETKSETDDENKVLTVSFEVRTVKKIRIIK